MWLCISITKSSTPLISTPTVGHNHYELLHTSHLSCNLPSLGFNLITFRSVSPFPYAYLARKVTSKNVNTIIHLLNIFGNETNQQIHTHTHTCVYMYVYNIDYIVYLLHVSVTLVAILSEVHYKGYYILFEAIHKRKVLRFKVYDSKYIFKYKIQKKYLWLIQMCNECSV